LDRIGKADTTIVFFLSDNGACADSKDLSTVEGAMPWEVTSYLKQGRHWANASNTPYRKFKTTDYEGGTRTPMIAYWPGTVPANSMTDHVGHLVDFTPTMLDLAGVEKPAALPGHSLVPALQGKTADRPWPIYWQFNKAKAIRDRDWKLVKYGNGDWELYNIAHDPTELTNLAASEPDRVEQMAGKWEHWWSQKQ
jgi:arylsulfatase